MVRGRLLLLAGAVLLPVCPVLSTAPAAAAAPEVVLDVQRGLPGTPVQVTPQQDTFANCTAAWDDDPPVFFGCGPSDGSEPFSSVTLTVPATAAPGKHAITVADVQIEGGPLWQAIVPFLVQAVVPQLVDHSLAEAQDLLSAAGLVMGRVSGAIGDPAARITFQMPPASSAADPASRVDVLLAAASSPVERPATPPAHASVPPVKVTSSTPTPRTTTPTPTPPVASSTPRSSRTPVLVTVPDVRGMTGADARSRLARSGLRGKVESGSGPVTQQRPVAGSRVRVGSQVSLYLRAAVPELVTVPDVRGLRVADARKVLAAAGLTGNPPTSSGGTVAGQLPAPGSRLPPGSVVTLTLAAAPSGHLALIATVLVGTGLLGLLGLLATARVLSRRRRPRPRYRPQVTVRSSHPARAVTIRATGRTATRTARLVSRRHSAVSYERALP